MTNTEKLAQVLRTLIEAHASKCKYCATTNRDSWCMRCRVAADALAAYESRVQPASVPDPDWLANLRHELRMSKITHNFTLTRDELAYILGDPLLAPLPAQPASVADGAKVIAQFVAERVSMGRGDERYIGTADGSLGVTVCYGDPGEVRNDLLWLIADAILAAAPQPAKDQFDSERNVRPGDIGTENDHD